MKILAIAVLVALAVFLVLYVTLIGRRRLAQRTTTLVPAPPAVPGTNAAPGAVSDGADGVGPVRFGPLEAVYVSTTLHGDWLARVGAHGLGDRSRALVSVHAGGVLIERDGADDLWVPVTAIRSAGLAPGMAGKYVGADGLVVITWAVPEADGVAATLVDTGLRTRRAEDRGGLVDAVRYLLAAQQPQQPQHYPEQQHPEHDSQQHPHQQEAR
jgi:hypothetical protein